MTTQRPASTLGPPTRPARAQSATGPKAGGKGRQRGPVKRVKPAPQRTCVGCRTVNAKRTLVRLVRTSDGRVQIDPTGKAAGRGAYVHNRRACWAVAMQTGALDRALKVTMVEADRAALRAHSEQYSDDDI